MNHSIMTRILSMLLAITMVIGFGPMAVFAAETETEDAAAVTAETTAKASTRMLYERYVYDTSVSDEYFKVISTDTYYLAPSAMEHELILNNAEGNDRKIVHIFEVNPKDEDLEIMPGYWAIDTLDPDNLALEGEEALAGWKAEQLTKTVEYYEDVLGYNVIGAMNTALAYDSNAPYGYMVWNGVVLGTPEIHAGAKTYLAIDWEGNCELRSMSTPLTGNEKTAISANFGWLVKDGVLQSQTVERTSSDASRSMIGIKEDGTLIFCQVDGRNGAVSSGLSNYEMGEMMLALGCVNAVNCDGGGSSTFVSKREGETENTMRSIPSDGSERPTINSVILVSTAGATGIFDHANVEAPYDYIAPGATMALSAMAIDTKGFAMNMPESAYWNVYGGSEVGTIDENGVFTAGTACGEVLIELVYDGVVAGIKKITVVNPDSFGFESDSTVIPYGKSVDLVVEATYGADNWAVCLNGAYTLALSDENAAILEGNKLTASSDESCTGVDVVATYTPDPTVTDTLSVSFGKGSEIVFSFENGEEADFLGMDEMYAWAEANGASAPIQSNGNYSENTDSETFLATRENGGQVKRGDKALGVTLDYSDATFASWSYNMFFYTGEPYVLRDVANGKLATTLGMWVYIPEGAAGLAMQIQGYKNPDNTGGTGAHFYFTTVSGAVKNLNSCTEADIPESRWVYATVDLTSFGDYFALYDPYGSTGREPSFIRFYVKPTVPAKLTFYFDDITLDYSSAVEDRVLPTITNVSYATQDTAVELAEGALISSNTMSFTANVADNLKLNAASGKILVDGVAVSASVSGNTLSSSDVTLTGGVHTVTFEIQDELGNLAKVTRTFAVDGDEAVILDGHHYSDNLPEYDSVYFIDLHVADLTALDGLTTTLKLQSANTWEPEGIVTASGFTAAYTVNPYSNELTVTVTREAASAAVAFRGELTLISIPVRVWSWDGVNHVTGEAITPEAQFKTGYCPTVTIDCEVVYGKADYANGAFGAFGGVFTTETNLKDNINPWHYHDAEQTVLSEDPTCSVAGYADRMFCETCQSVTDWGTVIPATGHTYSIMDDQLVCDCSAVVTGNGLVNANGKLYYLIADKLVTGWQAVGNGWCYAAVSTKEVQTGEFTVDGLTYTADETGMIVKGAWVTDANGTRYSYGPEFYKREWVEIDGATYYFDEDTYMFTGVQFIPVNRNNMKEGIIWYEFAEDGKYIGKYNGFVTYQDALYYVVDGEFNYGGLLLIDGDYYYARTSGELVCGRSYWITKTNDLLPAASYTFGEDGKMIDPPSAEEPEVPETPEEPEVKNGIVSEDGKLWWYEDGVKTYAGLMLIDGDYYYARSNGEILTNRTYWITKTNDLLPAANYTFGADGKMIDPPTAEEPETPEVPEEPEVKNGIVSEDGKLWWYEDGVKTYAGLMLIDGDYYYARSTGEILTNTTYWITKTNDLLPAAKYTFGEDGKMIDPPAAEEPEVPEIPEEPEVKNGIVSEDGKLWWYVDGEKTYGGLMLIDGDYYYARSTGEIITGRSYWITKTNDLLPAASYTFGEDGKMINPPTA